VKQPNSDHPVKILLVEDNPIDVRMIQYALQEESSWRTEVVVAEDGDRAIQYLTRQNSFVEAAKPDMVILDLNLPKRDGTEVLRTIRAAEGLRDLLVIVLSSLPEADSKDAVWRANLAADGYLTKPAEVSEFLTLGAVLRGCYKGRMRN
jgi:two-component system, chemotaxis family, response regulator Rcp1